MANKAESEDDDELIAYLDGELGPDDERRVEQRLASDPAARARAAEYKKTFDMLDYLPSPEPSADFTNRTLTRIQPAFAEGTLASQAFTLNLPAPRRVWPELLLWAGVLIAALGVGYGARLAAKPYLNSEKTVAIEQDLPLIHDLPWFLGVDDLDFLRRLHDEGWFEHPLGGENTSPTAGVSVANQKKMIELFHSFPTARQQQLRTLHKQWSDLPASEREPLRRTLEAYAAWLERQSDADRTAVLTAANGDDRRKAINQIRERHWRESLPQTQKALLARTASTEETLRLSKELQDREKSRAEEWELAKRQWQPNQGDQKPWPFSDPNLAKQLDGYVKNVLGVDLTVGFEKKGDRLEFTVPPACRLTREQLNELKLKFDAAHKDGYWGVYGECLYRMAETHPSLPKPKGEPVVRVAQLPMGYLRFVPKDAGGAAKLKRFEQAAGKWPEFALAVHDATRLPKVETLPPLGPCRPGEFTDEVNAFLADKLPSRTTKKELDALTAAEGKWPEYPRLLMDTAKAHRLEVPGASLPGNPDQWAKFYRRPPARQP